MKLIHPYTDLTGGAWLRGNLHAHSTRSDGARDPEAVIDAYVRRGYDFLMLSDHDITSTRAECAAWTARTGGMILIPGNEITANGPHILHVDADRHVGPDMPRQRILNLINEYSQAPGGRGFAIINHPNWQGQFDHCTIAQMREWVGYLGMEIYNGLISRLDGSPYATDKWDMLLGQGRRVWGFANDDSHAAEGDDGLGWNMVYVKDRTLDGVVASLRAGRFYASTGVVINAIEVHGDTIRIETENAHRITALMNTGQRFGKADDKAIEVRVPRHASYVRFECWGAGESFAWTQPFFVEANPA